MKRSVYTIGSLVILLIAAFIFVLVPIFSGGKAQKRMPAFGTDKIISLADIAMYTDEKEVPLRQVFKNIYDMEGGKPAALDRKELCWGQPAQPAHR